MFRAVKDMMPQKSLVSSYHCDSGSVFIGNFTDVKIFIVGEMFEIVVFVVEDF